MKIRGVNRLKKMLSVSYWRINQTKYQRLVQNDRVFNATFRDCQKLPQSVESSREFRYIKLYRRVQAQKDTIWFNMLFRMLKRRSEKTGIGLHDNLNIGNGLIIGHAGTIVMNGDAQFGNEIMLTHGVTIGRDIRGKRKGAPIIGNRVCIRANSTVVGKITIGDDVLIAPNTFVNFDVPSHSVVIGNPATIHHRENATEGHLGYLGGRSSE